MPASRYLRRRCRTSPMKWWLRDLTSTARGDVRYAGCFRRSLYLYRSKNLKKRRRATYHDKRHAGAWWQWSRQDTTGILFTELNFRRLQTTLHLLHMQDGNSYGASPVAMTNFADA